MKFWTLFFVMIGMIALVGYIEDPCATEGLMQGCMD
mgnify:CR=1 FL=1